MNNPSDELEKLTQLELQLAEIDKQIGELITKRWELVKPTEDEAETAFGWLVDDPYNQLVELIDGEVGRWLIPDEVVCMRRMSAEDRETLN